MARPLRIEFAGAVYHITSRGNAQRPIYLDDTDRNNFLELLAVACKRFGWLCHTYCLMTNHYHLLIETQQATLSKGMKYLNGCYTQTFNQRHRSVGHVFQGRFKSILVEQDCYLLELSRYIILNPVRAQMVRSAKDWPWSSYRALVGLAVADDFLTTDVILNHFGENRVKAQMAYQEFVKQGKNQPCPWLSLKNQIFLGSDQFVELMQTNIDASQSLLDIPKPQKLKPAKPLKYYQDLPTPRNEALARAYLSGHYTLTEVGNAFAVSYATVSRAVKAYVCQM